MKLPAAKGIRNAAEPCMRKPRLRATMVPNIAVRAVAKLKRIALDLLNPP
jgi:hypothetical protein